MKTIKLSTVFAVMLAIPGAAAALQPGPKSIKASSPRAVVVSLYQQHQKRSPFFQIKSRALLDKYFTRELADLLWQDAHSSSGEVGALDGDPLFNAQDMEITNFSIQAGTVTRRRAEIPVYFENFGKKHRVLFQLVPSRASWKIADIAYDDGFSLVGILKRDRGERSQTIKVYLVAVSDNGKAGKKIGCGDSLVPVTRTIRKTNAPLTAALRELLLTPQEFAGTPKLENFWKGRNLKVESVSIRNQMATIRTSGEVFVAGVCDVPRIQSQIEETARQFPGVKQVKVFMGKQTLAEAIR